MDKHKAVLNLISVTLIVLAGCHGRLLAAYDGAEEASRKAGQVAAGTRKDGDLRCTAEDSLAAMARMIDELRQQIDIQRQQLEILRSALAQQQAELSLALRTIEAKSASLQASADASGLPGADIQAQGKVQQKDEPRIEEIEIIKGELEAIAASAAETNQRLAKLEADTASHQKSNDARFRQIGNFNFSGDIRVRYEPFLQEGAAERHRERIRVRFHMTGRLSDEISGGLSLATGSLENPISTNQTLTGFFTRKNFAIDRAYVTYRPAYAKFLKLEAGKFGYPWYRTPLTFDSDLNPEGFSETLSFDIKSPVLKNITLVGFQLPINEVSGGHDGFVLGGQIQAHVRINAKARLALYGAGININRADAIAVALGGALRPSLPNSNTLRLNQNGTTAGYATKFAYLDAIMRFELDTHPRFPAAILFNFVNNTRGSRERSGYWAEVSFGNQKEVQDVQFGYSFIRIEKDAVIGAWNESSLRSSTNVRNHRLHLGYMFKSNFTGQFAVWIGNLANPRDDTSLVPAGVRAACTGDAFSGCRDPYLKRLQFDLIYKY